MEKMNALTLIITLVVGVILTGALLGPVISDATKTEQTFENEGYFYLQKITAADEGTYTFSYTFDGETNLTFNGEPVDLGGITNPVTLATDGADWFVRYGLNNEYVGLQIFGTDLVSGGYGTTSMTIEFSGGTVTATRITDGSDTPTVDTKTYNEAWIYSPEKSDYVMKKADSTAYMHADSEYVAAGQTTIKQWFDSLCIVGNNESFTVDLLVPEEDLTVTNQTVVSTAVNGYNDLYALSKLTFTASYDDASTDATYSYFIVPAEVTSELTNHLTPGQISLMGAIPVMVIVALLMIAVGAIAYRRAD